MNVLGAGRRCLPEPGIFIKTLSHFWCRYLMLLFCIIQETAANAAVGQTQELKEAQTHTCTRTWGGCKSFGSRLAFVVVLVLGRNVGPKGNTNRRVPKHTNKCGANQAKYSQGTHMGPENRRQEDGIGMVWIVWHGMEWYPGQRIHFTWVAEPPFELWHSKQPEKCARIANWTEPTKQICRAVSHIYIEYSMYMEGVQLKPQFGSRTNAEACGISNK